MTLEEDRANFPNFVAKWIRRDLVKALNYHNKHEKDIDMDIVGPMFSKVLLARLQGDLSPQGVYNVTAKIVEEHVK